MSPHEGKARARDRAGAPFIDACDGGARRLPRARGARHASGRRRAKRRANVCFS